MLKISFQILLLLPFICLIGIALALQTTINSQLSEYLYSPLQAALFSFLIGTIVLAVGVYFESVERPTWQILKTIPWYLYLGGVLGVYAISMSLYSVPKVGLLTLSGLIIFGQLFMSMLIDHFGLLGAEKITLNWQRILGGVVIFIGVLLTLQR